MSEATARLALNNKRSTALVAIVEPWGEEFTLAPGEEAEVVAISTDEHRPWFNLVSGDGWLAIYLESTDDYRIVRPGSRSPVVPASPSGLLTPTRSRPRWWPW